VNYFQNTKDNIVIIGDVKRLKQYLKILKQRLDYCPTIFAEQVIVDPEHESPGHTGTYKQQHLIAMYIGLVCVCRHP